MTEKVESGLISPSASEWKTGSDKLFVTFLSSNKVKIEEPINYYFNLLLILN